MLRSIMVKNSGKTPLVVCVSYLVPVLPDLARNDGVCLILALDLQSTVYLVVYFEHRGYIYSS